jgi:hypothetical protein
MAPPLEGSAQLDEMDDPEKLFESLAHLHCIIVVVSILCSAE